MYTFPVDTEYTEAASVYISKISRLLTRVVLFIANYAWYLANTMYLLMIGEILNYYTIHHYDVWRKRRS